MDTWTSPTIIVAAVSAVGAVLSGVAATWAVLAKNEASAVKQRLTAQQSMKNEISLTLNHTTQQGPIVVSSGGSNP